MAPKEEIARFRGKYTQGWDALRQARFERQKKMGIVGPDETLPGRLPNTYNWDKLTPEQRDRFDKIMATYAADITGMDKAVGTLIDRLKASGDLDNTLILFMSRSEEHTSELQSLMRISYAVFCLKKKNRTVHTTTDQTILHHQ